jgi:uncharacterized protein (TIGR03437 family)
LILFGTGWRYRRALADVSATAGGVTTPVSFAGAQGDLVGLDQANLLLPHSLKGRGEIEVRLRSGRTGFQCGRAEHSLGPFFAKKH